MKFLFGLTLSLAAILLGGCAAHPKKSAATAPAPMPAPTPAIVTADNSLTATVAMYNPSGRFVVLNFPTGNLPKNDQVFFIYHAGLKAGEVKITGPQHDNSTVADLTSGAAEAGDEVRDR